MRFATIIALATAVGVSVRGVTIPSKRGPGHIINNNSIGGDKDIVETLFGEMREIFVERNQGIAYDKDSGFQDDTDLVPFALLDASLEKSLNDYRQMVPEDRKELQDGLIQSVEAQKTFNGYPIVNEGPRDIIVNFFYKMDNIIQRQEAEYRKDSGSTALIDTRNEDLATLIVGYWEMILQDRQRLNYELIKWAQASKSVGTGSKQVENWDTAAFN